MLRELRYTWEQISGALMISRTTLWRRLRELGIHTSSYTQISDADLDSAMSTLVRRFPNNGTTMMWGHLRSLNIVVTRSRVQESLLRVSESSVQMRQRITVQRRVYNVPAPNCLWHIDGLHCLIRWRIVLHGGIDGYSRRIVYLRASDNNMADTVEVLFRDAVNICGWPSRVRCDKGGENINVARAMLNVRGTGQRRVLVGNSVHNQRIERLWRDVFRCVCHYFYSRFYAMEEMGILNPIRDADLFALHYVFIPRINNCIIQFVDAWNHHPLRTEHGLSPLQLWQRGMICASPQWQQEILHGFSVPHDYGIEDSGVCFSTTFEQLSLDVPRVDIQFTPTQLIQLQNLFSPLVPSDNGGVDIYVNVRQHIFNVLNV